MGEDEENRRDATESKREGFDIDEELRLAIWHEAIPGKTTNEKIAYIFSMFKVARETNAQMIDATPGVITLEDEVAGVKYVDEMIVLPHDAVTMEADFECIDCGGLLYYPVFITQLGWTMMDNVEYVICPYCHGTDTIYLSEFLDRDISR